jgi:hypothetical protein
MGVGTLPEPFDVVPMQPIQLPHGGDPPPPQLSKLEQTTMQKK